MAEVIRWSLSRPDPYLVSQAMLFPKGFWPITVRGGDEVHVWKRSWKTTLNVEVEPIGVWTFIGLDRGDIVEADVEVYTENGTPLVLRSVHKETLAMYDAWQYNKVREVGGVRLVKVFMSCRAGVNELLGDRLSARIHFGVIIIGRKV